MDEDFLFHIAPFAFVITLKIIAYFAQKVYFIERENADDDGQIINEIKRGQIPSAQYV